MHPGLLFVFDFPPPFRRIQFFNFSNFVLIVVIFCCFYRTLYFISPMSVGIRAFSVKTKGTLALTDPQFDIIGNPRAVSGMFLKMVDSITVF